MLFCIMQRWANGWANIFLVGQGSTQTPLGAIHALYLLQHLPTSFLLLLCLQEWNYYSLFSQNMFFSVFLSLSNCVIRVLFSFTTIRTYSLFTLSILFSIFFSKPTFQKPQSCPNLTFQ